MGSSGCLVQPESPASASEALITLRKPRRDTGSIHSAAWVGNSRCTISRNAGVSANSSTLRQYFFPVWPASFALAASSVDSCLLPFVSLIDGMSRNCSIPGACGCDTAGSNICPASPDRSASRSASRLVSPWPARRWPLEDASHPAACSARRPGRPSGLDQPWCSLPSVLSARRLSGPESRTILASDSKGHPKPCCKSRWWDEGSWLGFDGSSGTTPSAAYSVDTSAASCPPGHGRKNNQFLCSRGFRD